MKMLAINIALAKVRNQVTMLDRIGTSICLRLATISFVSLVVIKNDKRTTIHQQN